MKSVDVMMLPAPILGHQSLASQPFRQQNRKVAPTPLHPFSREGLIGVATTTMAIGVAATRQRCRSDALAIAQQRLIGSRKLKRLSMRCRSVRKVQRFALPNLQPQNCVRAAFRWEQGDASDQEVRVFIPISEDVKSKNVFFELVEASKFLRVGLQDGSNLLEGELFGEVVADETYFELEILDDGIRYLVLYLAKQRVETWEQLMRPCYTWEQTGRHNEELQIYIPLHTEVEASDVEFQLGGGHLRIGLKGSARPFLDDDLWGHVDLEDSSWTFDKYKGQRCIVVSLAKLHVRECWDRLLKTEAGKTGLPAFQPGEGRKDADLAVLDSLDYVNTVLTQKDLPYAQGYLDHILRHEDEDEEEEEEAQSGNSGENKRVSDEKT
eukprot:TRINITY_DN34210_c0_g1_i1.p1 TRINITY_DN34210_c0_g1~~TRINITY_DN34210_c0_g1_i1.p1  ORF type:complete len:381 (+),score=48.15 TRINITY_DN34210_c0_g1_i1:102-1244(+)